MKIVCWCVLGHWNTTHPVVSEVNFESSGNWVVLSVYSYIAVFFLSTNYRLLIFKNLAPSSEKEVCRQM